MNQVTYQIAIARHEELLQEAARCRLASQTARATNGTSTRAAGRSRRRISAAAAWRRTSSHIYTPAGR